MNGNSVFETFTLPNGVALKNRLLMAPMTTCSGFHDGCITEDLIAYYRARAEGLGAIIVESCYVDDLGPAFPGSIGIDADDKIEGLAKLVEAIHSQGSKAILQIYHGGRMVEPLLIGGRTPVAPSAVAAPRPGFVVPHELSETEIQAMIEKFGQAVHRAIIAGFDGVELHGANTYLLQQFLSPHSNRRQDHWGGDLERRTHFPLAVLAITQKMVQEYGTDAFIIGYRFSPEEIEEPGIRFEDSVYLMEQLARCGKGLDYVHFSLIDLVKSSIVEPHNRTPLIHRYCQMRSETLARIPTIGVGGILRYSDVVYGLEQGYDLIAVGRACIAYPDWVERIKRDEPLELTINIAEREALQIPEPLCKFPLVEVMFRECSIDGQSFKPGVFIQRIDEDGQIPVIKVNIEAGGIQDIEIESEDADYIRCFGTIRNRILDAKSVHVDAISGATYQSEKIKKAVARALAESTKKLAAEVGKKLPKEHTYDVVVVGSGGAGLAAAIAAHEAGVKVLIVEQMPTVGGNTIKASVGMNAAATRYQKVSGIEDTQSKFYEETLKGGNFKNRPELLQALVEGAPEAIEWLADRGIMLNDLTITGGMGVERTHRPRDRSAVGGYLIKGLMKQVKKQRVPIWLDTKVVDLVYDQGQIRQVIVENEDKERLTIHTKSLVIATGGFGANHAMVSHYRPDLAGFVTTNHAGALGTGIDLLKKIGADTCDMSEIQIHPTVEQKTSYLISEAIRGGGAILVSQQGERFFNEMETRDKVSAKIIALPEKNAYILFDQQVRMHNKAVEEYIGKGLVVQADSLEQLAQVLGLPWDTFQRTIERYNQSVAQQKDEEFGRTTALRFAIQQAPFYAIQIAPGIHHTMGGVAINPQSQVLNAEQQPLQGVFAAGEVTGGVHGANRIGGNAIADIIIFGVKAGAGAAEWAQQSL